jgi:hypothetical protein
MHRLFALAIFSALVLSSASASAQGRVQVGILECTGGETAGFIIGSVTDLSCMFRPEVGPQQAYHAVIRRAGVDLGATRVSSLIWGVFAPTREVGLGDLSGNYGGVTAGATIGAGLGANVLVGGSSNSFALQPVSVGGQLGLNVFAGVAGMELRFGR